MMKGGEFHKFEKDILKSERANILMNFRIVEALYEEAVDLGYDKGQIETFKKGGIVQMGEGGC